MGRGNPSVSGEFEGLFMVDLGDMECYYRKGIDFDDDDFEIKTGNEIPYEDFNNWEYDDFTSAAVRDDFLEHLQTSFCEHFEGFSVSDEWVDRHNHAILENGLFYITLEYADTMLAIKLIQKEGDWDENLSGLQMRHYKTYLGYLKRVLFEMFETIYSPCGAWLVSAIHRNEEEEKVS